MALRYEGWEVATAHTGSKAVAAAKDSVRTRWCST